MRSAGTALGMLATLSLALPLALGQSDVAEDTALLKPCHIKDHTQEVRCGSQRVFENRASAEGRQIDIHFAVIPAVDETVEPDPIVVFAGGPGQAAMDTAAFVNRVFRKANERRDIVLIDQRGMGASHQLQCDIPDDELANLDADEQERRTLEFLKSCRDALDADVTQYTQNIANEDIHEILQTLGYQRVNLFGVSWGTRSALLYAHQFPEHVRTMVLDGNLPLENAAPLNAAADAERALRRLFADCAGDAPCNAAFPDLEGDLRRAMRRLGDKGVRVTMHDPTDGELRTSLLTPDILGEALRSVLYSPELSRIAPLIIHQAAKDDYRPLQGVSGYLNDASGDAMSLGASLTIFCSEEFARIAADQKADPPTPPLLGRGLVRSLGSACEIWPTAPLPKIYSETIRPEAPALLLSGELDPITPPRWGEAMAKALPNSRHLIATGTAHNVAPQGCAPDLIHEFIDTAKLDDLDGDCLGEIARPTFFTHPSGPAGAGQP